MDSVTDELENSQIKIAGRLQAAYFRCNNNLRLYDKASTYISSPEIKVEQIDIMLSSTISQQVTFFYKFVLKGNSVR